MDVKALKKLAEACRSAGIKHFKNSEMEFTLTDDKPVSNYKKKVASVETQGTIENETLSADELLFWSIGNIDSPTEQEEV